MQSDAWVALLPWASSVAGTGSAVPGWATDDGDIDRRHMYGVGSEPGRRTRARWEILIAAGVGVALLALAIRAFGLEPAYPAVRASLLFGLFVLCGEFVPVRVLRRGDGGETTIATSFALALVVTAGVLNATVILVAASLVADVALRKPGRMVLANAARYLLAMAAAGGAFELLHGRSFDGWAPLDELLAVCLAGVVFFLLHGLLAARFTALVEGRPLRAVLQRDVSFRLALVASQLAMAPMAVLAAQRSVWLVPLLLVPAVAVHRSARLSMEKQHEALQDPLTRLPNRGLFQERLQEVIQSGEQSVAVLFLDLDRLREVNDTLGHHVGDRLLQQIGPRLRGIVGPDATVGRLGGDEFGVVLPEVDGVSDAMRAAVSVAAAVAEPFRVKGLSLAVEANIGVAVYPDHADGADELLQRADIALYLAKERHSAVELYDAERGARSRRSLGLIGDLRRAIDERELALSYQPQVDVGTGRIRAVEALLRWHHPVHGLVLPDEFIPLAEHTVLMDPLTVWVIDEALSQCSQWRQAGLDVRVAVNLSVRSLHDLQLTSKVAARLRARNLPASCLELELTESSIMAEPQRAMQTLSDLARLGVRLSVDDFGTGYSSLAYLKRLPVHEVKIDRSFIRDMATDPSDAAIVRSTMDLARNLGLEVVAEGVESREVWEALILLGCDYAQGRYLSPPLTAVDATARLREGVLGPRIDDLV